jgi:menaquinone-dependent protoporphyrinogen oxidase
MFHWEIPALELVQRERAALASRKVWLFSSGPVGDGKSTRHPETVPHPDGVDQLADEIGVRGRAMFGGRVDPRQGGFAMAIMAKAGLEGDWRDLPRVRSWAQEIAAALRADP